MGRGPRPSPREEQRSQAGKGTLARQGSSLSTSSAVSSRQSPQVSYWFPWVPGPPPGVPKPPLGSLLGKSVAAIKAHSWLRSLKIIGNPWKSFLILGIDRRRSLVIGGGCARHTGASRRRGLARRSASVASRARLSASCGLPAPPRPHTGPSKCMEDSTLQTSTGSFQS